ncbi:MAG: cell division protein FtsZ [Corallococcus sp.]|nr:cell division protein FtsZ [Corallococcus sp.]
MATYSQDTGNVAQIMVIGVGGGGGNAVDSMIKAGIKNVDFIAMNTDEQALHKIAAKKLAIGKETTKGLGAGANPEIGRKAAEESSEFIKDLLEKNKVDLLFIAAGMGGGTGTGAAPIIANIARQLGILTIAVVTKPFNFEGVRRMKNADVGIENLKGNVDALVIVQNEKLNRDKNFSVMEAFVKADEILLQGVRAITDIIVQDGRINLDLADVRCVMKDSGMAHMGIGVGKGKNKTIDAIRKAVYSPLLETTIQGASSIIINFRGGEDLKLDEIHNGLELVRQVISPDANVLFGMGFDSTMKDEVQVTLIATGFTGSTATDTGSFFSTGNVRPLSADNESSLRQHMAQDVLGRQESYFSKETGNSEPQSLDGGNLKVDEDKSVPPFLRKLKK